MMIDGEDASIHVLDTGPKDGPAIVFGNSLGTTLALWDNLLPRLPAGCRVIRFDLRGHGGSSVPPAPYAMDDLVADAERVMDERQVRGAAFVGLSIGGMIAQGLAAKRPDLIRVAVFSNTAAKIGEPKMWEGRIQSIRENGLEGIADGVMERWFGEAFRATPELAYWRAMMLGIEAGGYIGCCAAIANADLTQSTSALRLPVLGIAGSADLATPPDLVRETVAAIPGSRFEVIEDAGHLPCVEAPNEYARLVVDFLKETNHV